MAKTSFRGEMRKRWADAGRPCWNYEATERECLAVNSSLQQIKYNPAPRFREAVIAGNSSYIKRWIFGCHFDWLNPRIPG